MVKESKRATSPILGLTKWSDVKREQTLGNLIPLKPKKVVEKKYIKVHATRQQNKHFKKSYTVDPGEKVVSETKLSQEK
jgi:hypothetical protein